MWPKGRQIRLPDSTANPGRPQSCWLKWNSFDGFVLVKIFMRRDTTPNGGYFDGALNLHRTDINQTMKFPRATHIVTLATLFVNVNDDSFRKFQALLSFKSPVFIISTRSSLRRARTNCPGQWPLESQSQLVQPQTIFSENLPKKNGV